MIDGPLEIDDRTNGARFFVDDVLKGVLTAMDLVKFEQVWVFNPKLPENGLVQYWPYEGADPAISSHEIHQLLEQGLDVQLCNGRGTTLVEISLPRPYAWVYMISVSHHLEILPFQALDGDNLSVTRTDKYHWIIVSKTDFARYLRNFQYWRRPL